MLAATIIGLSNQQADADISTPPVVSPNKPVVKPRLDVVFTIDATGSMGDEIEVVKKEIWTIANTLMEGKPRPDIRFGLVFYQDRGDEFLVRKTDLTRNVDAVHEQLMAVRAGGGGDWQEHVGRGLHEALDMAWDTQQGVKRLIYLVGDAPSHDDYQDGYSLASAIDKAKAKKITIHTIGCSGLNSGRSEFEMLAARTNGLYKTLTYEAIVTDDSGVKRSVIYYDGDMYEAEGVLDKAEWGRGGDELIKKGRLKRARPATKAKAAAAPTRNNLDDVVTDSVKEAAEDMGVAY
ncbi:MAG: vWA domain-containing protein [Myxococcota bacterium]